MILRVGMVRGGLEGDGQRHLQSQLRRVVDEGVEVLEGSEVGMHGLVPAVLVADRPWAPRVVRAGTQRVVRPLSERRADGMDRREVHHVEPEGRDVGEALPGVFQRAVAARLRGGGAREQLVPGAESGPLPVGHHAELPPVRGGSATVGVRVHELAEPLAQGGLDGALYAWTPEPLGEGAKVPAGLPPGPPARRLHEIGADLHIDGHAATCRTGRSTRSRCRGGGRGRPRGTRPGTGRSRRASCGPHATGSLAPRGTARRRRPGRAPRRTRRPRRRPSPRRSA